MYVSAIAISPCLVPNFAQVVAFLVGYVLQDIKLALFIALGGTALTFLVAVPPWPIYNRNPVKWLPVGGGAMAQPITLVVDDKTVG